MTWTTTENTTNGEGQGMRKGHNEVKQRTLKHNPIFNSKDAEYERDIGQKRYQYIYI